MAWPTPEEYNEAVQTPTVSFIDADVRNGHARVNKLGLPRVITGSFASVYSFHCGGRDFAVRCFLRSVADQKDRYTQLTKYI